MVIINSFFTQQNCELPLIFISTDSLAKKKPRGYVKYSDVAVREKKEVIVISGVYFL